jgi:tetratricopeptide (TPR) repeat protein
MGRDEVAKARFRDALNLFPESATLHNKLGQTLVEQDRHLEAVLAYRRTIALNPDLVDAHYNLGATYQVIERYDEAEQAYRSALDIDGIYALAHIGLGELYLDGSGSGDCLTQSQSQLC